MHTQMVNKYKCKHHSINQETHTRTGHYNMHVHALNIELYNNRDKNIIESQYHKSSLEGK